MTSKRELKELKSSLNGHIESLNGLDGSDTESVRTVNESLDKFFNNLHESTLPRELKELDEVSLLFEQLNLLGFKKAKKHNLVYSPYMLRISEYGDAKVKVSILGLEEPAFKKRKR